jgi:pyruvate formate lyase activating enzyme
MSSSELDVPCPSSLGHGLDPDWGFVHSEHIGSAVDGPGLRSVFWLTGCGFRCLYCHNPDTWRLHAGRRVHVDELVGEVAKYASFMATSRGGVTLSGGEPLVQHGFCMNVFRRLRALGVHTALDTNGFLGDRLSDDDLAAIDLVILDLKSWNDGTHLRVTGQHSEPVLRFARRLHALRRPTWVRFVLVPGLTDQPDNVNGLARFCAELPNVERVEVLPFHQLGRFKWHELGLPYALEHVEPPTPEALTRARDAFRSQGVLCPD